IHFGPLTEQTILEQFQQRGISPADAAQAIRWAEGSLGLALKWLQEGVIQRAGELAEHLDNLLAGRPGGFDLPAWFKAAAEAYAARQLERDALSSKDQATREGLALYLKIAAEVY